MTNYTKPVWYSDLTEAQQKKADPDLLLIAKGDAKKARIDADADRVAAKQRVERLRKIAAMNRRRSR